MGSGKILNTYNYNYLYFNKNYVAKNNIVSFKATNLSEQKQRWDAASEIWASCKQKGGNTLQKEIITKTLLKELGDVKQQVILDAGCGEGFYSRLMSGLGARVTGVDFSNNQIQKAKEIETTNNLGIKYINESVTNLKSIKNNSIDKIVSIMLTMYLDDSNLAKTMQEFQRVLKPDGELLIITRHPFTTRQKDEANTGSHEYLAGYFSKKPFVNQLNLNGDKLEVKYYPRTISELFNCFTKAGFVVTKIDEPQPSKAALLKYKACISLQYYSQNPMAITIKARKIANFLK